MTYPLAGDFCWLWAQGDGISFGGSSTSKHLESGFECLSFGGTTSDPTPSPSYGPTKAPTKAPTPKPSKNPSTFKDTAYPTTDPTKEPTTSPTDDTPNPQTDPTKSPTPGPTAVAGTPTKAPTERPTKFPTDDPTADPTPQPTPPDGKTRGPTADVCYKYIPDHEDTFFGNDNNHSGHDICDLYVSPKYSSFKEEIGNYEHFDFKKQYKDEIVTKATKYENTQIVKATKAGGYGTDGLHYGVRDGVSLCFQNLVSLILYCDYTDLCSHFSSTFRKKAPFEPINSIKKRNSEYFWLSKILRETVELFGKCSEGELDRDDDDNRVNQLLGSYFCGMSVLMNIPEFSIFLCSPTSTSMQIEVAIKFSGDDGIIIQLDNPQDTSQYSFLRGFDCSWLSRYKEEDERYELLVMLILFILFCLLFIYRLFFGGYYRIKIESIRIRRTRQNFETFIYSLWCFDTMITGGKTPNKVSDDDVFIIGSLMNILKPKSTSNASKSSKTGSLKTGCNKNAKSDKEKLDNEIEKKIETKQFDDYIYSTFNCFIQNKQQIILDLDRLNNGDKKMRDLIMYPLDGVDLSEGHKEKKRKTKKFVNVFRSEIFGIFKNVKTIIIITTDPWGETSYSLSLSLLLSLIESTSLDKVIVKAVTYKDWRDNDKEYNWIYSLWSSSCSIIKEEYDGKNYTISIKEVKKEDGYNEYWFEINKN